MRENGSINKRLQERSTREKGERKRERGWEKGTVASGSRKKFLLPGKSGFSAIYSTGVPNVSTPYHPLSLRWYTLGSARVETAPCARMVRTVFCLAETITLCSCFVPLYRSPVFSLSNICLSFFNTIQAGHVVLKRGEKR